ncbi:MAG TPA: DUF2089 family protein [Bacteroidetes bacterium]|nr:DUF2089 family protein [Bacteroidota bacterium]
MDKKLPVSCPACGNELEVKTLFCPACETTVSGLYELPLLSSLRDEDQLFIIDFVKNSGNLKIMAKNMGLSYPTVRHLLDGIIHRIKEQETHHKI